MSKLRANGVQGLTSALVIVAVLTTVFGSIPAALAQSGEDTGEFVGTLDNSEALATQGVLDGFSEETANSVQIMRDGDTYTATMVYEYKWESEPNTCDGAFGTNRYEFTGTASVDPDDPILRFDGNRVFDFESIGLCGPNSFEESPLSLRLELVGDQIIGNFFPGSFEASLVSGSAAPSGGADCEDTSADTIDELAFGVIEVGCILFLNSRPGEALQISRSDLPDWAQPQLATVGALVVTIGAISTISDGDESVLIDGIAVAVINSGTTHGGFVVEGADRIFVNGVPAAAVGSFTIDPTTLAAVPRVGGPIITTGPADADGQGCLRSSLAGCANLKTAAKAGDTSIDVDSPEIKPGDLVVIDPDGSNPEGARVVDKGSLIFEKPLAFDHLEGTVVAKVPEELSEIVARDPSEAEIAAFEASIAENPPDDPEAESSDADSAAPAPGPDTNNGSTGATLPIVILVVALGMAATGWLLWRRRS